MTSNLVHSLGFPRPIIKSLTEEKVDAALCYRSSPKCWDFPLICATTEASNFKFGIQPRTSCVRRHCITASDMRPGYIGNVIIKYTDDTYLVVPAANSHTSVDKLLRIQASVDDNNLRLNTSKAKEITFRARGVRGNSEQLPPQGLYIERVTQLTALSVIRNDQRWRVTTSLYCWRRVLGCCTFFACWERMVYHSSPYKMYSKQQLI